MKTIFFSISRAVFIHVGVCAALLVGCTNNEYPASRSKFHYEGMSPERYQRAMRRSAREAEIKADLEASGYKVEYGGGLY